MPVSVAYCVNEALLGSGSEHYRVHRAAHLLGHQLNWLTFVTSRFAPPEGKNPWLVEVEGQTLCPNVIILRPSVLVETRPDDDYTDLDAGDAWDEMRRNVERAQKVGQIVLLDLDDHPYAWNTYHPENRISAVQWEAHDRYVAQFNAVLCSTKYLRQVMADRFNRPVATIKIPDFQRFEYAPNLYDPWRYHPETAKFGKVLGSHLFVKARDQADFTVLGDTLRPIFDTDPELRFLHIGEEFACRTCLHPRHRHFELQECDECACEEWKSKICGPFPLATGLHADQIIEKESCNPADLPDSLTYNVGVVPLADSPWNDAKTEGKGFEMAAAGIPFIALTGDHPLYKKSPGYQIQTPRYEIDELTTNKEYWEFRSKLYRKWAETIAQEHQIEFVATMKRLAAMDLSK